MCRMRITEVARHARVSTATVSRTINRTGNVRPDTAEKVWRVVRKLGYHPDTNARALVSGRSHHVLNVNKTGELLSGARPDIAWWFHLAK